MNQTKASGFISNLQELQTTASEEGVVFLGAGYSLEQMIDHLDRRLEETTQQLQNQITENNMRQAQPEWEAEFHGLSTTPGMVVAAAILTLHQRTQDEYEKTLEFITRSTGVVEGVETPLKKLLSFLGCNRLPKSFSTFCELFTSREKEGVLHDDARELASFLAEHTVRATFLGTGKEELLAGLDGYLLIHEWAAYKELEAERNKAGHPNVIQVKNQNDPEERKLEVERVALSSTLLKKVLDAPSTRFKNHGLGHFPDPSVDRFRTLVNLAANPEPRVSQPTPINLWIGGRGKLRDVELGPLLHKVNTEKISVLVVEELSEADVAVLVQLDIYKLLHQSDVDSEAWGTIGECLMHGVTGVLLLSINEVKILQKDLQKKFNTKFGRGIGGTIHVLNLTEKELHEHGKVQFTIFSKLQTIHLHRPSKDDFFRMVIRGVAIIDGATKIRGRVKSGVYKPGSRLILDANVIDASKSLKQELERGTFVGAEFQVDHIGVSIPVPGSKVSIVLATVPKGEIPNPGSVMSDFRSPVMVVAWPFMAEVLVPFFSPGGFSGGDLLLQPVGSPMKFKVSVRAGERLGPGECGVILVNSPGEHAPQGLMIEAPERNQLFGNYGLTMFKLFNLEGGGDYIAAGQVMIEQAKPRKEKRKSSGIMTAEECLV